MPSTIRNAARGAVSKKRWILGACIALGIGQLNLSPSVQASTTPPGVVSPAKADVPTLVETPPVTAAIVSPEVDVPNTRVGEPKTLVTHSGSRFVYPRGCENVEERVDLVFHFHGVHTSVIPSFLDSRLDAVLVIVNLGIGSGSYSNEYKHKGAVDALLQRSLETIQKHCGGPPRQLRRLALSSWSAGYGATQQVLRLRPGRVDAVLLSDGLHVGYADELSHRVQVDQMQEFVDYAELAARGKTLLAITHSGIIPPGYAAAAETAMALADAVEAPVWPVERTVSGMQQLTAGRRGDFFVDGFAGRDKQAHAKQLHALGQTNFARLRVFWKRRTDVQQE